MSKVTRGTMLVALAAAIAAPMAQADVRGTHDAYGKSDAYRLSDAFGLRDAYRLGDAFRMNPWKDTDVRRVGDVRANRIGY